MSTSGTDLCFLTIAEAGRLIKTRALSPVELTEAYLQRIREVDGTLHAYLTVLEDDAVAEARAAEKEIQSGNYRGPLHGIPVALKDLYDTAGVEATAQSKVLEGRTPEEDSTVMARLRQAGCILLGKLTMNEFAFGAVNTDYYEYPRNPWNIDYMAGGSSIGSGVATAAGLCAGSMGSDTGGSIVSPSSLCGVVGLKPTYGLVSRYGVIPLSWSLDHCGPMTWTVEDNAIMLQAIAGHDPRDPNSQRAEVPYYRGALARGVEGLKIGVPRHFFTEARYNPDRETLDAVERALRELEGLGAKVEEMAAPSIAYAGDANLVILLSEALAYHKENLKARPEKYGWVVRRRLYLGALLGAEDYLQAQRARSRVRREMAETLSRVDVLAFPSQPRPADSFAEFDPMKSVLSPSPTSPFDLTGLPALSVPCGFSSKGLPIGLELAGRAYDEATLLAAANAYQNHAGWHQKRPQLDGMTGSGPT